jgi:hypothetical protein
MPIAFFVFDAAADAMVVLDLIGWCITSSINL